MKNTVVNIDELLTGPEIAFLADVKMATFERWNIDDPKRPKVMPDPFHYFGLTPVWELKTITDWLDSTDRTYDVKAWRKHRDAGGFRRRTPPNAKAAS